MVKKKYIGTLVSLLCLIYLCSGCGGSGGGSHSEGIQDSMNSVSPNYGVTPSMNSVLEASQKIDKFMIYTVSMQMDTDDYDGVVEEIENLVSDSNSHWEFWEVTNDGTDISRRANYTIKVPSENLTTFMTECEALGLVRNNTLTADPVEQNVMDIEARIEALTKEETSLVELIEQQSYDLNAVLMVRDRITNTKYEIERLKAIQRDTTEKVKYSTVHISVKEVIELPVKKTLTYMERLVYTFNDSWNNFSSAMISFSIWIIGVFPLLLIAILVYSIPICIVVWIIFKLSRLAEKKFPSIFAKPSNKFRSRGDEERD